VGHPLVRGSRASVRLGSAPRAAPPRASASSLLPGSSMSASMGACGGAAGTAELADSSAAAAARPAAAAAAVAAPAAAAAAAPAAAGGPVHMTRYVRLFWPSTLHAAYRAPFGEGIHAGLVSPDGEAPLEPRAAKVLPYISPTSPLYLPYISPTSRAALLPGAPRRAARARALHVDA